MRVPSVDPKPDKLIKHFEKKLAYFQDTASHRRDDEAANEGEATCRAVLAHLRGDGLVEAGRTERAPSLDEWLNEIEEKPALQNEEAIASAAQAIVDKPAAFATNLCR
jgi:hypothetical protein